MCLCVCCALSASGDKNRGCLLLPRAHFAGSRQPSTADKVRGQPSPGLSTQQSAKISAALPSQQCGAVSQNGGRARLPPPLPGGAGPAGRGRGVWTQQSLCAAVLPHPGPDLHRAAAPQPWAGQWPLEGPAAPWKSRVKLPLSPSGVLRLSDRGDELGQNQISPFNIS